MTLFCLGNKTRVSLAANPENWPDIEYFFSDAVMGNGRDFVHGRLLSDTNYVTISAALVAPFSRGNATLRSPDTSVFSSSPVHAGVHILAQHAVPCSGRHRHVVLAAGSGSQRDS